ncbi:MAG: AEC family transporter [Limisphaerales bacterium]
MSGLGGVLNAVLPVLGVIAAGFAFRRLKWLTEEADRSLVKLVVNVLAPCLILDSILGNAAFARLDNVLLPPLLGFATTAAGVGLGWLCRRTTGEPEGVGRLRTFAFCSGVCNYGYVPLPLAQTLFDQGTVGVLFVTNMGVEIAMWWLGFSLLRGGARASFWRNLLSPPVVTIVASLALNFTVPREQVPVAVLKGVHMLGGCAIPLGLLMVGATVADLLPDFGAGRNWRVIAAACLVRLVLCPLLFLALVWLLPLSPELERVMVLHGAMPAAVFPIIMARHYGGDSATALRVVVGTSVAGVVTIPLWISAGLALLDRG